jgi:hypothetical protein
VERRAWKKEPRRGGVAAESGHWLCGHCEHWSVDVVTVLLPTSHRPHPLPPPLIPVEGRMHALRSWRRGSPRPLAEPNSKQSAYGQGLPPACACVLKERGVFVCVWVTGQVSFDFVAFTAIASAIAGLGLITNNTVMIVASMLVSPLMGPILAFTVRNPTLPTHTHIHTYTHIHTHTHTRTRHSHTHAP